jgi:hypothetical protein
MIHLPHAKTIIGAATARGNPIPGVYANPPTIRAGLELQFEAFSQLSTCRAIGMESEGQIPWTAIMQYADYLELDDLDDRAQFCRMIRALDHEYLNIREEQRAKARKSK